MDKIDKIEGIVCLLIIIAIVIIFHHIHKHDDLKYPDRIFQISDISNHETWVIACLSLALGVYIGGKII